MFQSEDMCQVQNISLFAHFKSTNQNVFLHRKFRVVRLKEKKASILLLATCILSLATAEWFGRGIVSCPKAEARSKLKSSQTITTD